MFREIWTSLVCMWKGHRKGDLYIWKSPGPFFKVPGCLRCKAEFRRFK